MVFSNKIFNTDNVASAVSIASQPEVISPLVIGNQKNIDEFDLDDGRTSRKSSLRKSTSSRRLGGRLPTTLSPSLRAKSALQSSWKTADPQESSDSQSQSHHSGHHHHHLEHLIDQVSEWIKEERTKHDERKAKRHVAAGNKDGTIAEDDYAYNEAKADEKAAQGESAGSFDLDRLESIIKHNLSFDKRPRLSRNSYISSKRKGSLAKQRKQSSASSDTDNLDGDIQVPSCDVVLDNSKTLAYTGGASDDSGASSSDELQRSTSYRDRDAWSKFKFEIVRLSHTLRLKGWRKVPMEMSSDIEVQRLSGALTNAVYVVSPPGDLPSPAEREDGNGAAKLSRKPPPKLLLRIYGPQVGHLIDREAELKILRRLCRKNIGPRLLATFANGRFEEYLHAKPLTPEELRDPDTSNQIAKRMRELHDGIELLDQERDDGPFVWRNWDKWVDRVEKVVSWLDCQIEKLPENAKPTGSEAWKRRGFICGVPWHQFREMVEKYRKWLFAKYGGWEEVREQLIFSHNDTQYGNILRVVPTGESPLLMPANSHKQLIVIDFEYANANLRGLEFANHFTEWCYNYHDARRPYAFHPKQYPTPEEQDRFIRAYIGHRPQINISTPQQGPRTPSVDMSASGELPSRKSTSSISSFLLDVRAPPGSPSIQSQAKEEALKSAEDQEVASLIRETRIWRLANTAQWVAWGLVQAKIPGMPDFSPDAETEPGSDQEAESREDLGERGDEYRELAEKQRQAAEKEADGSDKEEADEEFDYLGYSQHRALFFWADAIQLGLAKVEELPDHLREKVKKVPY